MIRLAAVADTHCTSGTCGRLASDWRDLNDKADLMLLGGDLTTLGTEDEARVLADELRVVEVPKVAVLGNHDYHDGSPETVKRQLEDAGVIVLEGTSVTFDINGQSVGVVGTKGFGGGFAGACATDFGEPEMKAFVRHTQNLAGELRKSLAALDTDYRIVLLHYSPIDTTLEGEPLPIYPFLGSYLLGEACDEVGADLILHGHAHKGSEKGVTPGGIPVRNVAMPLVRHPYVLFHLEHSEGYLPFPMKSKAVMHEPRRS